jgi:hypothetical protein
VKAEEFNPWEDGALLYQAGEIRWADGTIEKTVSINTQKNSKEGLEYLAKKSKSR